MALLHVASAPTSCRRSFCRSPTTGAPPLSESAPPPVGVPPLIGEGTYSSVFKERELETGRIVALKKVRFDYYEPESVRFMAQEIMILRRLNHPNIVKLEGIITARLSSSSYLVFEYMEHDLAGLSSVPDIKFSASQVKCYMHQLLSALEHCHSHGVMHRDIKYANYND